MEEKGFLKLIDWLSVINDSVSFDEMLLDFERNGIKFGERHIFNYNYVVVDKESYSKMFDLLMGSTQYRITRIDIKFDYELSYSYLLNSYGSMFNFSSCVGNMNGTQTVYFGSRNSDLFCRLYDKTSEAGLDFDLSRLEYEIKGSVARIFSSRLSYIGFDDAYNYLMSTLYDFSAKHNLLDLYTIYDFSIPVDFSLVDDKISKDKFIYFVRHNGNSFLNWLDKFDLTAEEFKSLCYLKLPELYETVHNF